MKINVDGSFELRKDPVVSRKKDLYKETPLSAVTLCQILDTVAEARARSMGVVQSPEQTPGPTFHSKSRYEICSE